MKTVNWIESKNYKSYNKKYNKKDKNNITDSH